ncbi:MAG: SDR family oxidoreductase [Burkholderiaceae bacterium]|nr:SDR family oxidoreductase [Burkholderiaceae bacterium]
MDDKARKDGDARPPQHQDRQPGREQPMRPAPESFAKRYTGSGKLDGKVAIVTGGDSGIGRSTAICFAKEGADVAIVYLDEHDDAQRTREAVEQTGRRCLLLAGDVGDSAFCQAVVDRTVRAFGRLDVLVNNAAEQHPREALEELSREQLEKTFRTNFFGPVALTRAALEHLESGGCIVNTASVTAYRGSHHLLDYAATKGALIAFTRSLAKQVVSRGIRVNAVAPGPVWTPLIPASFDAEEVARFGRHVPMGRAAEPDEISPSFVFLASADASYMTGQVLHPNGGEIVNG